MANNGQVAEHRLLRLKGELNELSTQNAGWSVMTHKIMVLYNMVVS